MSSFNRRSFIKTGTIAGAGVIVARESFGSFLRNSPSDKVVLAGIGIRSRGLFLAEEFAAMPNVTVKYVVDVDSRFLAPAIESIEKKQGSKPIGMSDFRKVLDDKEVDGVFIATPDHWHAPMAIMAVQAGKHVYVEKPCSHNPHEGELLTEAFKKYGKLIQMGSQRRSMTVTQNLVQEVKGGIIGNVYMGHAFYTNKRDTIGFGKEIAVPEYLNWDLWQGPAPRVPYRDNIHPYNWHWFWNWGTGEALNNGTHELDMCRWVMGLDYPTKASSMGGRYHFKGVDDWQTPDTQNIMIEFDGGKTITWEGRSCNIYDQFKATRGCAFYGDKGTIIYKTSSYEVFDTDAKLIRSVDSKNSPKPANVLNTTDPGLGDGHCQNFIEAIRGKEKLTAPVTEGQKSVLLCQLGNISLRAGRTLNIDPTNGHIINDREANKLWGREYENGWAPKI
jgi:predicted dehydrogenase